MSILIYPIALCLAFALDWATFTRTIDVLAGAIGAPAREYRYRDFLGLRAVAIALSAALFAYSTVGNGSTLWGVIGAGSFLIAHFCIYFSIFYEAWRDRR